MFRRIKELVTREPNRTIQTTAESDSSAAAQEAVKDALFSNIDGIDQQETTHQITETGLLALAQEAVRDGLISQDVLDQLTSLHPQVPTSMKHRYLLACFQAELKYLKKTNKSLVNFSKYASIPVSSTTSDDIQLDTESLPDLIELTVSFAHKWREIGIALRFKPQDLDSIQACPLLLHNSPRSYLTRLLEDWLLRILQHTLLPTKANLERALRSETVGLGALASKINSKFCENKATNLPYSIINVSLDESDSINSAIPSGSVTVVMEENELTLLEIQVSSSRNCEYQYKWYLDDEALPRYQSSKHGNGLNYSNPGSFLCIKADIDWTGRQISCEVTSKEERVSNGADKNSDLMHFATDTYWPSHVGETIQQKYSYYEDTYFSYGAEALSAITKATPVILHVICPLDKFRDSLASMYLAQPEVPEDAWPPVGNKKYINLALIKQERINYGSEYARLTIRGDVDDVLQHKDMIKYEDVYKSLKSKQLVLIEGRPGSGKTTFVHKLSRDWATNSDGSIRLLLLVSLRVLNYLNTPLDLSDILKLFKDLKVSQDLVEKRAGKGVCFIFDGLDEFSPPDGIKSVVYKIINKTYLSKSTVIVASRPAAIAMLMSRADKAIEVVGFLKQQIIEYFDYYPFSDMSKAIKLTVYLNSHPNILHMCYLPIHAAMVAFLFEVTGTIPKTETEIYTHFTRFTLMRTLAKTKGIDPSDVDLHSLNGEEQLCFKQICHLALEKTLSNKQVLHQDEVSSYFEVKKDKDMSLGLITVDRTAGLYGFKEIYTFLHLTFQEYLAAYHISTLSDEEQIRAINEHGHKYHMLVVWKFFCGLKKSENIFELILDKTKGSTLFHIQSAYESQQQNICVKLLNSMGYHILLEQTHLTVPDFTAIGYIANTSVLPFQFSLIHCDLNVEAVDALQCEMDTRSENCLESLHMESENLEMDCIRKLLNNLPSLKNISIDGGLETAIKLTSSAELLVRSMDISALPGLFNSLSYTKLNKLTLRKIGLDGGLSDLYLTECASGMAARSLLTGFSQCSELQTVDLSDNRISPANFSLILAKLKSLSKLKELYLDGNLLGKAGVELLSSSLQYLVNLQILSLGYNGICQNGGKALAANLHHCAQLQQLDLEGNDFGVKTACAIVLSLNQHCTQFKSLVLPRLATSSSLFQLVPNQCKIQSDDYNTIKILYR